MCKVNIDAKLNEEIEQMEIEEIINLAPKIKNWIMEGNKKKIMQLNKSKILYRVHLHGRHRRMVFSYIDGIIRVYEVFTESDEEKKIKFYDTLSYLFEICQTKTNELEDILRFVTNVSVIFLHEDHINKDRFKVHPIKLPPFPNEF